MSFNGNEGSSITLSSAATLTENWRDEHTTYKKGYFFGKNNVQTLLDQSGSKGIRCYFGRTDQGQVELILVAADSNEDDQLGRNDLILEGGVPCPSNCGEDNDLNS